MPRRLSSPAARRLSVRDVLAGGASGDATVSVEPPDGLFSRSSPFQSSLSSRLCSAPRCWFRWLRVLAAAQDEGLTHTVIINGDKY